MSSSTTHQGLLRHLISRGDHISICDGRLVIQPASGKPINQEWIEARMWTLASQILELTQVRGLRYLSYDTKPGFGDGILSLQFEEIHSANSFFAAFNVSVKRARNTTAGNKRSLLPKGHFRFGPRSAFARFLWGTGLEHKKSSAVHGYMGNLKHLIFTGERTAAGKEKLDNQTIGLLSVPYEAIKSALEHIQSMDNIHPSHSQPMSMKRPSLMSKESVPAQSRRGIQPNPSTVPENHSNTDNSNAVTQGTVMGRKLPENQSTDEWLAEYTKNSINIP